MHEHDNFDWDRGDEHDGPDDRGDADGTVRVEGVSDRPGLDPNQHPPSGNEGGDLYRELGNVPAPLLVTRLGVKLGELEVGVIYRDAVIEMLQDELDAKRARIEVLTQALAEE